MLRNGQFDNLQWDRLAKAHSANWKFLKDKYSLPPQQSVSATSLSELAAESIRACREYLFTDVGCKEGWQTGKLVGILPKDDLEECMTPALCDHLVVTFAYRYFCDNLTPKARYEYLNELYNCLSDPQRVSYKPLKKRDENEGIEKETRVVDKEGTRVLKSNFTKPKRESFNTYQDKIGAVFSYYEQQLQALCCSLSEDHYARLKRRKWIVTNRRLRIAKRKWKNTTSRKRRALEHRKLRMNDHVFLKIPREVDRTPEVEADIALIRKEREARDTEQYAAPNWIYSIAMACTWTNSPLALKKGCLVFARDYLSGRLDTGNLLKNLAGFLGSSDWGAHLFGKAAPESKRLVHLLYEPVVRTKEMQDEIEDWQLQVSPDLLELRLDAENQAFVSVPYIQEQTYRCPLPPQEYKVIDGSQYTIPCEVQQMFNSYLVERTFHGYASVLTMECINRRKASGSFNLHRDQYQLLPAVVRLRAPLLHPTWIQFADYLVGETPPGGTPIPWIEDHVDDWNRVALPILEEHFIRSVWLAYQKEKVDKVLEEITKALMQDDGQGRRCDRLNFYRLIPVGERTESLKADDVLNNVMKNTYVAGLGCKLGQVDKRGIDPGRATAFEEA